MKTDKNITKDIYASYSIANNKEILSNLKPKLFRDLTKRQKEYLANVIIGIECRYNSYPYHAACKIVSSSYPCGYRKLLRTRRLLLSSNSSAVSEPLLFLAICLEFAVDLYINQLESAYASLSCENQRLRYFDNLRILPQEETLKRERKSYLENAMAEYTKYMEET